MEIKNGSNVYQVGIEVGTADGYDLYLCKQNEIERQYLLQIAAEVRDNIALSRATYILEELKIRSDKLEAEYAPKKKDPKKMLNYQLGFPELLDTFISSEHEGRRINVLAFRNVEDVSDLKPLRNIVVKDCLRVDIRSSAWIMGKALKMLAFTQSQNIAVELDVENILIEPNKHYVVFFDFSTGKIFSDEVPSEIRCEEISQAAKAVIIIMGGDLETDFIPDDGDPAFKRYANFILRLAKGNESNAKKACEGFYEIVHESWPREFYPFTTIPLY